MADRASGADADRPTGSHSLREAAVATLDDLRRRDLLRNRRTIDLWSGALGAGSTSPEGLTEPIAIVDGQLKLVFCSNDYLGLSRDPRVIAAFQSAAAFHGVGSGASHLITGHHREHHALEEELAAFVGRQRALLFSTGYHANLGVVSALLGRNDTVVEDRLNHASLIDAAVLSRARLLRYPHADAPAAEGALARSRARALLVTDGVFSMDGDIAPLPELVAAVRRHDAWLMVDDAHGLGVVGPEGRGTTAGMAANDVPLLMGTLGKALGTFGAFVAADREIIELLLQKARTYVYTTALPPAVAAATRTALTIAATEENRRERLCANIARFRTGAAQLKLPLLPSDTAIQPLIVGSSARAVAISDSLWSRGLWVSAIRPPTVAEGTARLRIALSASHTVSNIDLLLESLSFAVADLPAHEADT